MNIHILIYISIPQYSLLILHNVSYMFVFWFDSGTRNVVLSLREDCISCSAVSIPKLSVLLCIKCLHFKANKINLGHNFILYFLPNKITLIYFTCRLFSLDGDELLTMLGIAYQLDDVEFCENDVSVALRNINISHSVGLFIKKEFNRCS